MNAKRQAEKLAKDRGFSLEANAEGRCFTVRIEAPRGQNFGGNHELVVSYPEGARLVWPDVIKEIEEAVPFPCDADTCGGWVNGACEWWQE